MQHLMTTVLRNDDDVHEDAFNLHEKKLKYVWNFIYYISEQVITHFKLLRKLELFYFSVIASYICICIYIYIYT